MLLDRIAASLSPLPMAGSLPSSFDAALQGDHRMGDTARLVRPPVLSPAAVLVPVIDYASGARILLTRRQSALRRHSGQIAFPGGRAESHDADLAATALRETEEEVGLDRSHVSVMGALSPYITATGFAIAPIVARVAPGFSLQPDASEVAEAFEVPLDFLLDPANHHRHEGEIQGAIRTWWAMPYGDYYIWGATAGILRELYERTDQAP
jgi:8-oxo-dGTP pyrophosphatase MutT (NUDIX family)